MHSDLSTELLTAVKCCDVTQLRNAVERAKSTGTCTTSILGHALCVAAEIGATDVIKELLRYKADVLHVDERGRRPIHFACLGSSVEALKQIIRGGSPLSVQDNEGASALHLVVERQNRKMVSFLVKEGATVTRVKTYANNETPLHVACRIGDESIVRTILKKCVNANMCTVDKCTPLMYAVIHHHIGIVQILCEFGVNINQCNAVGNTALSLAVEVLHPAVDILLRYGADPNISNIHGRSPLHVAALQLLNHDSYERVVNSLIDHGADLTCRDLNGHTPLHSAALAGNVPVARLLLDHGADVDLADDISGHTPLHLAVSYNRNDIIELLVENGANVNICEPGGGMTVLHKLLTTRNPERNKYVEYFIQHGAKINAVSLRGYTPLDQCVFHSLLAGFDAESLLRLVQAGAQLKRMPGPKSNIQHNSPLCWLTWHGYIPVARFLIECGWDLRHENWIRLPGRNTNTVDFLGYIWSLVKQPRPLKIRCRTVIRNCLIRASDDTDVVPLVRLLPLPPFLKRYINLDLEIEACKEDLETDIS